MQHSEQFGLCFQWSTDYLLSDAANSSHILSFTPIYKAQPDGKLAALFVRPLGSPIPVLDAHMFTLASVFSFNSPKKRTQGHADDLRPLQSGSVLQFAEDGNVSVVQSNRSDLGHFLHLNSLDSPETNQVTSANCSYTNDIQAEPKIPDCVTESNQTGSNTGVALEFAADANTLPLDWLLTPRTRITLHERIMARLIQAEAHEANPHLKQDYRQAFICVSLASRGNTEPFLVSSYQCHGTHPDLVWFKILANREARLGKEYPDFYDAAGNQRPDLPKKPSLPAPNAAKSSVDERLAALIHKKEGA